MIKTDSSTIPYLPSANHVPQSESSSKPNLNNPHKSPEKNKKTGKVTIGNKFKKWATNLNFKLDTYAHNVELDIPLTYLGQEYTKDMKEALEEHIAETIWFSYREKIPPIMAEIFSKKPITCDRGWGCMIRCGQMILAESIKRHYAAKGKLIQEAKHESILTIVSLFSDFVKEGIIAPFSIQQLCRVAYESFGSKPGDWYRASSVMMSLDILNEKFGQRRISNFRMCILKEGTIYEDQVLEKAFAVTQNSPTRSPNKIVEQGNNNKSNEGVIKEESEEHKDNENPMEGKEGIDKDLAEKEKPEASTDDKSPAKLEDKKWNNSVLIFVATKTGLSQHNDLYLPTILRLLRFPQSVGILGGKRTKGYYFLGSQGGTLLYLDPHYVQESCQSFADLENRYDSHFRKKFFQVEIDDIDTSVGFGFYIADEKDYAQFKRELNKAIAIDPNFLIGFQETTPSLDIQAGDIIELDNLNDEVFESDASD